MEQLVGLFRSEIVSIVDTMVLVIRSALARVAVGIQLSLMRLGAFIKKVYLKKISIVNKTSKIYLKTFLLDLVHDN